MVCIGTTVMKTCAISFGIRNIHSIARSTTSSTRFVGIVQHGTTRYSIAMVVASTSTHVLRSIIPIAADYGSDVTAVVPVLSADAVSTVADVD